MAFDPFDLDESGGDFDSGYTGTITSVEFRTGKFGDLEAEVYTTYDEPRAKNDGTLSIGRPQFIKVAGKDQGFIPQGDSFTHPDGKKPRANSAWGKFVTRLKELGATTIVGTKVRWDNEGAGDPYTMPVEDADSLGWMTTAVREGRAWVEKGGKGGPRSTDDPDIGDLFHGQKKGTMMPVEVLVGGNGHSATFDLQTLRDAGLTAVMESDLVGMAKVSDTPQDLMARVIADENLRGFKPLTAALGDQGLLAALKSA